MLQPITKTTKEPKQSTNSKRNRFPLLSLEYSVTFQLPTGEFHVDAREVSHDEVRVICPAGDIPLLVPRTAHHRPDEKILHTATLQLSNNFSLTTQLQVLSCRRYSQQGFNVNFRIPELTKQQQFELENFLRTAIEENIPTASMFG